MVTVCVDVPVSWLLCVLMCQFHPWFLCVCVLQTNEKGQVTVKSSVLKQMEDLKEETGLTCCICREGYRYQPQKVSTSPVSVAAEVRCSTCMCV